MTIANRRATALLAVLLGCAHLGPRLHAGPPEKVLPLDKTTVAVTDFTDAGRELPVPTPESPIYYTGVNAGQKSYTSAVLAGDPPPPEQAMLKVLVQVLADQHYRAATPAHPATQIIVVSWGTIGVTGGSLMGPGPGLGFLGGAKMDLIEEQTIPGHISADVFRRSFRSGSAETVYEMSRGSLYAVLLRAYDLKAAEEGRIVELWETRIACSSPGTCQAKALPRIVVSGRYAIGRDTPMPVVENAARTRHGYVEFRELQVLDFIDPADLARARAERAKNPPAPEKK